MNILEVKNLRKRFHDLEVIKGLDFVVPSNTVFGFIGKNGAGKTTTMKMILGFLESTEGEIYVCGEKVSYGNTKTNRHIGYLPDVPAFYDYMKPKEYLRLCGEITGLNKTVIEIKSKELLELVGLAGVNRRIRGFSRGMKQRLGIAQALLNEPALLICDEPTSALDPVGRKEILDILSLAKAKTTIVFSTHILSDVERICDQIGVLDGGRMVLQGTVAELKSKNRQDGVQIEFATEKDGALLESIVKNLPYVLSSKREGGILEIFLEDVQSNGRKLLSLLGEQECDVLRYEILEPSLENIFMEVIE